MAPPKPTLRIIEDYARTQHRTKDIVDLDTLYSLTVDDGNKDFESRAGYLHPSSAGYCMRKSYYGAMRIPPTDGMSERLVQIMELGHAIHDIVQRHFEELAEKLRSRGIFLEFTREVPYDPNTDSLYQLLGLGGTCDGILRIWVPGQWEQRGTLEIKSIADDGFTKVDAGEAQEKHLMQSHIYAFRFNTPIIWILYYNKNNSARAVKPYFFSPVIFEKTMDYFWDLAIYVHREEEPPREESWFDCKECAYRSLCKPKVLQKKKKRVITALPSRTLTRRR